MRAFITGGLRPPSDASSDAATLENGCTPGSIESTSSVGHGEGGGGQGMGFRDQGSAPLMGPTTGGAPGTRSQELGAGLYYQPAAAGQPYLSVAQGMPGMAQALQGLPHGMQGLPHYGSLGLIGAGGPPIGGAIGGGSMGSGPIGGGPIGGAAGYMQFPVGSSGGGGCGATAPIGRASIDWFAGTHGAHGAPPPPPPPGGARIGRSSFDEDCFRKPGGGGGAPIGSGLQPPLIGSGAGPLIGGMPAPLAGGAIGHAGAQALVPGGPLLSGMAMGADPLALGVGQISLPASKTSLPYPAAPISAGEAAAFDFGSALYNRPGGGGGGLDAGVLRRSSSLEAGPSGLGQGLGSGIGAALGSLEQLQGGLAPGLAVPPSVFSASTGSESGARTATGSYASSAGGRGEPGPPLTHMGSVAEDSVFQGDDAPPYIKARRVSSSFS